MRLENIVSQFCNNSSNVQSVLPRVHVCPGVFKPVYIETFFLEKLFMTA